VLRLDEHRIFKENKMVLRLDEHRIFKENKMVLRLDEHRIFKKNFQHETKVQNSHRKVEVNKNVMQNVIRRNNGRN